jgi:hypothetical protein
VQSVPIGRDLLESGNASHVVSLVSKLTVPLRSSR